MRWVLVAFLINCILIATHAGFELSTLYYESAHSTTTLNYEIIVPSPRLLNFEKSLNPLLLFQPPFYYYMEPFPTLVQLPQLSFYWTIANSQLFSPPPPCLFGKQEYTTAPLTFNKVALNRLLALLWISQTNQLTLPLGGVICTKIHNLCHHVIQLASYKDAWIPYDNSFGWNFFYQFTSCEIRMLSTLPQVITALFREYHGIEII